MGAAITITPAHSDVFPVELWSNLFAEAQARVFRRGQIIFSRDDWGDGIYLIETGRVRISVVGADGRELSFLVVEPGMIFGEIAALDRKARTADASAMSAVTTRFIPVDQLNGLIEDQPELARAFIHFLCDRIRAADIQMESIALMTLERRVAAFLLVLVGNTNDAEAEIRFDLSQSELAKLLGASRPKVNAILKKLTEDGTISVIENRLRCDVKALRAITES